MIFVNSHKYYSFFLLLSTLYVNICIISIQNREFCSEYNFLLYPLSIYIYNCWYAPIFSISLFLHRKSIYVYAFLSVILFITNSYLLLLLIVIFIGYKNIERVMHRSLYFQFYLFCFCPYDGHSNSQ